MAWVIVTGVLATQETKVSAAMILTSLSGNVLVSALQWRHNQHDGVSNYSSVTICFTQPFIQAQTLRVFGLCEGNSPATGEVPAQRASNAQNVSIWRRHHEPQKVELFILAVAQYFVRSCRPFWIWATLSDRQQQKYKRPEIFWMKHVS